MDRGTPLALLRQLVFVFASALVLIGIVAVFLASTGENDQSMPSGIVAAGVAVYGVISLFVPRFVERPLDCASPESLEGSYRTRFFLRIAFADAAALVGFVGVFLAGAWWVYLVGVTFALVGFVRLAPTQRNLERDQEALNLAGCGHSLEHVLRSTIS